MHQYKALDRNGIGIVEVSAADEWEAREAIREELNKLPSPTPLRRWERDGERVLALEEEQAA